MTFGKQRIDLANFIIHIGPISLAQNVSGIERNFFAKRCAPAPFCLAHKGW